jgi:hypothetical protein
LPRNILDTITFSARISSVNFLSKQRAQTFWNPRKLIMWPALALQVPSFFRDSQFLFYLTIFSTHFFDMFLMRLSCHHWPPWPCFPHKLASPISCLNCSTQCLTVLTSIHLSPAHCLHTAMNVNGKNFFCSQGLNNSTFFEPHNLTAFHFDWHETGLLESYGFKVTYSGWEISRDCVEQVLSSFHYSNKKYDRGGKIFQPILLFMYIIMPSFAQLQLCINTRFICRSIHFGRNNLEVGIFLKQASLCTNLKHYCLNKSAVQNKFEDLQVK